MPKSLLSHTMNTRDLGGHPTLSGGYTRCNRFLRSDLPTGLSENDVSLLRRKSITTVIDLRSIHEKMNTPSFFENRPGFEYRHCPLSGDGKRPPTEEEIPASYLAMLCGSSVIFDIMKIFADTDTGFLFHCTAGKDRTGVIAALLLSLAEVPMPDILADYQISYPNIRPMVDQLRSADPALPAWVGQSKPEYLSAFLSSFQQKYQSIENYLLHLGLSAHDIRSIQSKLVSA